MTGIGRRINNLNTGFPKNLRFLFERVFDISSRIPIRAAKIVAIIIPILSVVSFVNKIQVIAKDIANTSPPPLAEGCFNIIPGC